MDRETRLWLEGLDRRVGALEAAGGSDLKIKVVDTYQRRLQSLERQFSEIKALVEERQQ